MKNYVNNDIFLPHKREKFERDAGNIFEAYDRYTGDPRVLCHARHKHFFHFYVLPDYRSPDPVKTRQNLKFNMVFFRHLDGAVMKHLRAERRKFEHLVVRDLLQFFRGRHFARICGINSVNVGIYLTFVRFQNRGESDGGRVRAASAESRHIVEPVYTLKSRYDDDLSGIEFAQYPFRVDFFYFCV